MVSKEKISATESINEKEAVFPGAREKLLRIPVFLIIPIAYVVVGRILHLWHPTWLVFFFIPMYYQLCIAVGTKTKKAFLLNLPVVPVIVCAFLTIGLTVGLWSYIWMLFLLIPVYYWYAATYKE